MEGNKFILFRFQLTAVWEVLHGNVKLKLIWNFIGRKNVEKKLGCTVLEYRTSSIEVLYSIYYAII
jgi:hypothetical protein